MSEYQCYERSTIEQPMFGRPHAPDRVRGASPKLAEALRAGQPDLDVACAPDAGDRRGLRGGREAGFDMNSKEGIEAWMRLMQSHPLPASVRLPSLGSPARPQDKTAAHAKKSSQGCPQGAQEEPMTRRDPYSWTVVPLPERDLAELVLELAAPLLERLGPAPAIDDAQTAVALAVTFWNASVLASKRWEYPRVKELNALKKRMRGRAASREDAATFDLAERWRQHWLDSRLVERRGLHLDAFDQEAQVALGHVRLTRQEHLAQHALEARQRSFGVQVGWGLNRPAAVSNSRSQVGPLEPCLVTHKTETRGSVLCKSASPAEGSYVFE